MKHGKRPTREQRKLIEQAHLRPGEWLVTKNLPDRLELVHYIATEKRRVVYKNIGEDDT